MFDSAASASSSTATAEQSPPPAGHNVYEKSCASSGTVSCTTEMDVPRLTNVQLTSSPACTTTVARRLGRSTAPIEQLRSVRGKLATACWVIVYTPGESGPNVDARSRPASASSSRVTLWHGPTTGHRSKLKSWGPFGTVSWFTVTEPWRSVKVQTTSSDVVRSRITLRRPRSLVSAVLHDRAERPHPSTWSWVTRYRSGARSNALEAGSVASPSSSREKVVGAPTHAALRSAAHSVNPKSWGPSGAVSCTTVMRERLVSVKVQVTCSCGARAMVARRSARSTTPPVQVRSVRSHPAVAAWVITCVPGSSPSRR